VFTGAEKATITWAAHLTKYSFKENLEALVEMKKHFDGAQIVEATLVSGYFNMWNRFVDSLEIDIEGDDQMNLFTKSVVIDKNDFTEYMNNCWWAKGD
jgi:metal-responsive CopG/Arc/MetJ family transcriptional regulator